MEEQKNYQTLDFIRIVASFFVVLVHVHLPIPHAYYTMAWARFAVPVFYMINDFFLFRGTDDKQGRLKNIKSTFLKIGRITLFTVLFYVISDTLVCLIQGQHPLEWLLSEINIKTLTELLLFNHTDFLCHVVWYLLAYIYVLGILYLLVRFNLLKRVWFLIPFLITANILMGEVIKLEWFYQGNWLITALPFILMGIYLRDNPDFYKNISKPVLWIMILGGSLITLVESLLHYGQVLYLGTIATAIGLFILGLKSELVWPPKISFAGRKVTIYIFIIHCSVRDFLYVVFGIPNWLVVYFYPLIVFVFAAMIGYLIYRLNTSIQKSIGRRKALIK